MITKRPEVTMRQSEMRRSRRRSTYRLLILIVLAIAAGRIAVVSRDGVTAFLSANDRSRWSTIASLVEHGTYAIDTQEKIVVKSGSRRIKPWSSIDKVRHTGKDGKLHYYSSKPPLFPTMVAGIYAVTRFATGMTLTEQPLYMSRIILALVNLPLLAIFFLATMGSVERICRDDWTRRFVALAICFGTMMLPFAISLNNHLPAAAATAVAMWIYLYAAEKQDTSDKQESRPISFWWWFAAGLAAAFAAANELPALSMMVFWGVLCFLLHRPSILPFAAGVAVVALGFFGTNWIAHESLKPAYAHRGNGPTIAEWASAEQAPVQSDIASRLVKQGEISESTAFSIEASDEPGRWILDADGKLFALLDASPQENATQRDWRLAHWDDWYEYPDTHWKPENLKGVDRGEPSRLVYSANMTIGHHGIFSLTPIWLLVPVGLGIALMMGTPDFRRLSLAILVASAVCIAFYIRRPEIDRNYGGVSVCFRWLLWFAPLWLLMLAPAAEKFAASERLRFAMKLLLALSVFSMATALDSPWQHPWIYRFWDFLGWIT